MKKGYMFFVVAVFVVAIGCSLYSQAFGHHISAPPAGAPASHNYFLLPPGQSEGTVPNIMFVVDVSGSMSSAFEGGS
ncbi:MAG: hypothetical protein V1753_05830, partial [Pseudomonadota bacterium]